MVNEEQGYIIEFIILWVIGVPIWTVNFSPRLFLQLSFLPYCRE